jgi:hypothetical protein
MHWLHIAVYVTLRFSVKKILKRVLQVFGPFRISEVLFSRPFSPQRKASVGSKPQTPQKFVASSERATTAFWT